MKLVPTLFTDSELNKKNCFHLSFFLAKKGKSDDGEKVINLCLYSMVLVVELLLADGETAFGLWGNCFRLLGELLVSDGRTAFGQWGNRFRAMGEQDSVTLV